jgi:hypothetical protein
MRCCVLSGAEKCPDARYRMKGAVIRRNTDEGKTKKRYWVVCVHERPSVHGSLSSPNGLRGRVEDHWHFAFFVAACATKQ